VYLNEPTTNGAVHKYRINADNTFTEIGTPWFDNAVAGAGLNSPHGLAVGLNGFMYIGESAGSGQQIRQFNCDGEIAPESSFSITTQGQTNLGSIDNTIYSNQWNFTNSEHLISYDICNPSQTSIARLCGLPATSGGDENNRTWGFYIDPRTEKMYATTNFGNSATATNNLYVFDASAFDDNSATCVEPVSVPLTNFPVNNAIIAGVTTDLEENIYIVVLADLNVSATDPPTYILKYGPDFSFLAMSTMDDADDGTGFHEAIGIIYSETTDRIYVSTGAQMDPCIASFTTDLTTTVGIVPAPGNGDNGKGIAITKECCPTDNNQIVSLVVCTNDTRDPIFLNEIFPCDGVICEAQWEESAGNSAAILNPCDLSINTMAAAGCYTFTRESLGGQGTQCGAFTQTLHVEIVELPDLTVSGDQTINCGDMASDLTATTTGTILRWESNTTSCGADDDWMAIPGTAGMTTYNPGTPPRTTHYRAIIGGTSTGNGPDCPGGDCELASNCVTVELGVACPPCTIAMTPAETGCVANGDGTFTTTYDLMVAWEKLPASSITLMSTGDGTLSTTTISAATVSGGNSTVITYTVPADGTGREEITATFDDDAACTT
ncbi:MAG: hypothetical protein AAGJ82_15950, partial [Bacteroidota bacterium]